MKHPTLIFDIKRYSINDGPGIRVTVFFKGCPLRCRWCHNPESQLPVVQKFYAVSKCIRCGTCIRACEKGALSMQNAEGVVTDHNKCVLCGRCAEVCPTKAMEMSGRQESVESIMKVIRKETLLMDQSGGGVTFSGGEPLQHPELLLGLLKACNKEGIHTAVDTCGHAETETLLEVAKYTDLFLYDLKHMDPLKHKEFTGVSNRLILENLQHLSEFGSRINIRIPLIDGFNADEGNIEATAKFVAGLPGEPKLVNLLPYHGIASAKYQKLGGIYDPGDSKEPGKEKVEKVISIFQKKGLLVSVGG